MKKINPNFKKFVRECCKKAAWNIGVSHYHIDIHYMHKPKEGCREGGVVAAEMNTNRRYLKGHLYIYPYVMEKWEDGDKDSVKHAVFHEVSHLATQHVMDLMLSCYKDEGETKDAWESLTETIARMALQIDEREK